MPDYLMSTGTTGQMMIRDTGYNVEFWITSNNSTTFANQMPWAVTVNGIHTGWLQYKYNANSGWRLLGAWPAYTTQTVSFYLGATGTSGLGGPTNFHQPISRAAVPSSPSTPVISNIGASTVDVTFTDGSDGGAAIDAREIGYGTNATTPTNTISSDGSDTVTLLSAGTLYYFWARAHNSSGWGAWSARAEATTLKVPYAPNAPTFTSVTPISVRVVWTPNGDGGSPITGFELGYSTSPSAPSTIIAATSPELILGLTPVTTYYFWVRAQNAIGWSPWSPSSNIQTIAGAWVKNGGSWVVAIAYVKIADEWEIAAPFVKSSGVWKPTT